MTPALAREQAHFEEIGEAADHLEQEARMVLPGVQALFGFQLIAVFNSRFNELTAAEQALHWLALTSTAIATIFAIAPAAYHRIAEPGRISREFLSYASAWLCRAMNALALGTCLDFYLIGRLVAGNRWIALLAALALFGVFIHFWYLYPKGVQSRRSVAEPI